MIMNSHSTDETWFANSRSVDKLADVVSFNKRLTLNLHVMAAEKSLAIVLRVVEYSESSYIATLFTEEHGKISCLAKGARRRKSSFESALDLLSISRVVFIPKTSDGLDLLTEARLEKAFRSSLRELPRLYAAYYIAELIQLMVDSRDPHPDLFRIAQSSLQRIDSDGVVADEIIRFEVGILRVLGNLPALFTCTECSEKVALDPRIAFGIWSGGVMCVRCKVGKRKVVSLSLPALQALRSWAAIDDQKSEMKTVSKGELDLKQQRQIQGELRGLMNQYICNVIGRRPRLFDFLGFS